MSEDRSPRPLQLPDPRRVPSAAGADIAAYDLGGEGADLLLVHATGFCAGVWLPLAAHLPGNRLAALDVRGHGRSTTGDHLADWNDGARDVLATVDALGLERPFGVGHSMGGALLLLAEQLRPGTFRGLWLFEPIVFPGSLVPPSDGPGADNPLSAGARRRRASFPSADDAYANFAAKPPLAALHADALRAYVEHGFAPEPDGSVHLRCAPEVEAANYEAGVRHRAFEHLGEIAGPVRVLRGRVDEPGPAMLAPRIAEGLPAGALEDHPELGHFGPLEDPAAMAASIRLAVTATP